MSKQASVSECLKTYLPFWRARGLTPADTHIICHFLYSNGAYKEILAFSVESLERDEPISWNYLASAIRKLEPKLESPVYAALKDYISDNRKLDEFSTCELFDVFFPNEGEIKLAQIQHKVQLKERHRQTLLDQIRVFNQSRNYNIEKQTIQKFIRFFPNDKLGKEIQNRFETEELQRFFQRYKNEKQQTRGNQIPAFSPEETKLLQRYFDYLVMQNQSNPSPEEWASTVYFFLFLEDFAHALQLLPQMTESSTRDWLQIELLILNNKFAEALSFLRELDGRLENDPSYFTAKVYYVAQCFWGLGDHRKAIELMENLIQIKPDYRMASSLLKDWRLEL
jgi:hypothetical protein